MSITEQPVQEQTNRLADTDLFIPTLGCKLCFKTTQLVTLTFINNYNNNHCH